MEKHLTFLFLSLGSLLFITGKVHALDPVEEYDREFSSKEQVKMIDT